MTTLEMLRAFFMWCSVINYSILILWFVLFSVAHDTLQSFTELLYRRKLGNFDALHYSAMAFFKGAVIIFNVVPWMALSLLH